MTNPDVAKSLRNGRYVFWQDKTQTVVIVDPNHPDRGTAFRPTKDYLNGL